jgi:multimeric flavodoxin WrbA
MGVLVTYYSRSGHTARLGRAIAGALGADVQEITSRRTFRGPWGFLAGGFQAARKRTPELEPLSRDPGDYEVVVVGTPVWAGTMASPVRSFLTRYGGRIRKAAFFLTSGGADTGRTFQEMEQLTGCAPLATLAMRARMVRKASGERLGEEAGRLVAGVRAADR